MIAELIKGDISLIRGSKRLTALRERAIGRALFAYYKTLADALALAYVNGGDLALDLTFNSFASPLNTIILDNNTITAGALGDFQMDLLAEKSLRMDHRTKQNARLIVSQLESFLVENAQKSTALTSKTDRENAAKIVARGLKRGSSTENIARSLRRQFGTSLGRNRAAVIARTETGIAGSRGEFQGAKNQKAKKKEWIQVSGVNRREIHTDVDGQVITMRTLFRPGGEKMAHPHDVTHGASAKNIVNCQCGMRFIK